MTIGERIKQRRLELGLSQQDLAERLGNKSRASVCTVEKDKEDMTTDRIRKYAEALETTPAYLMGWEDFCGNPIDGGMQNDRTEMVMALYKQYLSADPNIRAAIDTLLKSSQPRAEPLDKH